MASIFDYDSAFMRGLGWITDVIWVNLLLIVTCLPVVTVGAALTAAHDTLRRLRDGGGHVTRTYFRAFRSNFGKASLLWLVYGPTLALIAYLWLVVVGSEILVPKLGVSIVWLMGFEWVWYLQSRFENPVGRTLGNALVFSVIYWPVTLVLVGIDAACAYVVYLSMRYFQRGLFLLIVLGPGLVIAMHVAILEHAMAPRIAEGKKIAAREAKEKAKAGK